MSIWSYEDISKNSESFLKTWHCPFCNLSLYTLHQDINSGLPTHNNFSENVYRDITEEMLICQKCGWWKFEELVETPNYPKNSIFKGAAASLKEFDLSDISIPMRNVRDYLAINYDERFNINPRVWEETVASVFGDLGYETHVTGYRNDGGIDVFLYKGNDLVGVQVKRYKNSVEVEQIRSLAGALVLSGNTKGVFVTTSNFQSGCETAARRYSSAGIQIELINALDFYAALGIAQRQVHRSIEEFDLNHIKEYMTSFEY